MINKSPFFEEKQVQPLSFGKNLRPSTKSQFLVLVNPEQVFSTRGVYMFSAYSSPCLMNAAPLSTPWLDLLDLSSGIRWRRWDASCLHTQALWKSECYNIPKQLKLDDTVNCGKALSSSISPNSGSAQSY